MSLNVGSPLGSHSVTAKIGGGGIAQEYRAQDTKLDGDVAPNGLPQALRDRAFGAAESSQIYRRTTAKREAFRAQEAWKPGSSGGTSRGVSGYRRLVWE